MWGWVQVVIGDAVGALAVCTLDTEHWPVRPRFLLSGHAATVTALAVSTDLDLIVSAAADGCCMLHALRSCTFLRELDLLHGLVPGDPPAQGTMEQRVCDVDQPTRADHKVVADRCGNEETEGEASTSKSSGAGSSDDQDVPLEKTIVLLRDATVHRVALSAQGVVAVEVLVEGKSWLQTWHMSGTRLASTCLGELSLHSLEFSVANPNLLLTAHAESANLRTADSLRKVCELVPSVDRLGARLCSMTFAPDGDTLFGGLTNGQLLMYSNSVGSVKPANYTFA